MTDPTPPAATAAERIADLAAYNAASALRRMFDSLAVETVWGCTRRGEYFIRTPRGLRYTVTYDPPSLPDLPRPTRGE